MTTLINPPGVHPPRGAYHHVARIPPGAEVVHLAGQIGIAPDGAVAEGARAQSEQAFRNILACLDAAGMGPQHLVKLVIYLVDAGDIEALRAARTAVLGEGVAPASTLLIISGLASPDFLVEIEAIAAKD